MHSAWWRLLPREDLLAPPLTGIATELERPATREELQALAHDETYPLPVVQRLRELGLQELFADEAYGTTWSLCALNEACARADGSLAITVGVNSLALLPVWIGGSEELRAHVAGRVRAGAAASMLLTELDHGSNLARNVACAERGTFGPGGCFVPLSGEEGVAELYRMWGEKHLINGATHHELLVTLARTRTADPTRGAGPLASLADFTVLLVERGASVESLPRWRTLAGQGADIAGVRFNGTLVPSSRLVGREGEGLSLIQRTLVASRGGIGALAAGTAARALELTLQHARGRDVYGGPIVELGAISGHLLRLDLAALACAALSVRTCARVNALGLDAAACTATAKVACCALAEEAVTEGRRVLGSRALLREHAYERLVRDVTLFPVFDGTSHLMLELLASRLSLATDELEAPPADGSEQLAAWRELYGQGPRPLARTLRQRPRRTTTALLASVEALCLAGGEVDAAPLRGLTRALLEVVQKLVQSGQWKADQAVRFRAAMALALLETLFATLELADPGRRAALGIDAERLDPSDGRRARLVLAWLGGRVLRRVRELALSCDLGLAPLVGLQDLEVQLRAGEGELSRAQRAAYSG